MTNTTKIGRDAESYVAGQLALQGYQVIARNQRTRFYEIDIIAVKQQQLRFIEVKYRKFSGSGDGLEAITQTKIKRLTRAITSWLAEHQEYTDYEISLDVAAVSSTGGGYSLQYIENITSLLSS